MAGPLSCYQIAKKDRYAIQNPQFAFGKIRNQQADRDEQEDRYTKDIGSVLSWIRFSHCQSKTEKKAR